MLIISERKTTHIWTVEGQQEQRRISEALWETRLNSEVSLKKLLSVTLIIGSTSITATSTVQHQTQTNPERSIRHSNVQKETGSRSSPRNDKTVSNAKVIKTKKKQFVIYKFAAKIEKMHMFVVYSK